MEEETRKVIISVSDGTQTSSTMVSEPGNPQDITILIWDEWSKTTDKWILSLQEAGMLRDLLNTMIK